MSKDFRNKTRDSFGGGWVYNWHCLDYVGFDRNPRRRAVGCHKVSDHYRKMIKKTHSHQDGLHWHFHPMSTYREAHRCATSYVNSPELYETLCRYIVERKWFPVVFRAGFYVERPDSNWFLEQWIPFDASNLSYEDKENEHSCQRDISSGRMGDWRLAPSDWSIYHPSHDNYQIPGNCRRWIARTLAIKVRGRDLSEREVDRAFERANSGKPTIMGVTNHDSRDMASEVDLTRNLIEKSRRKYPKVKFKFAEAKEAFHSAIYGKSRTTPLKLNVRLKKASDKLLLKVDTVQGKVFGPQPFLAVKTKTRFIHDNFDFDTTLKSWSYTFDYNSIRPDDVRAIGVASNDKYGNTFVKVIKV